MLVKVNQSTSSDRAFITLLAIVRKASLTFFVRVGGAKLALIPYRE